MKNRFTTLDLIAILPELRQKLVGLRVNQVYDVDTKTFLIRFSNPSTTNTETIEEETLKQTLLLESGIRIHLTEFDWPKNPNPSGFAMKLRKHLRNKRLESITQLGIDRIVDLQFGTNEYTNHIIIEFFSKGNIILTDKDYTILSLIRFYKDAKTNINIAVREKYPMRTNLSANQTQYIADDSKMTHPKILSILNQSKDTGFKKVFNPHFLFGPALLEHSLLNCKENVDANKFKVTVDDIELLEKVFQFSEKQVEMFKKNVSKGFIIKKKEKHVNSNEVLEIFDEFHPYKFSQFDKCQDMEEYETFNKAVDVFFSSIEGQKIESKVVQQEKQAMKKLDAIKRDQQSRVDNLIVAQKLDHKKAEFIEKNVELVDKALSVIRSAIANKYSWEMINEMVSDAQDSGDLIALKIKDLKFDKNSFTMLLHDPYDDTPEAGMLVDIDIGLSAHANARKYYGHKKDAAKKEQKTIDNAEKIFKNVQRKVKQQLKETTIKTNIVLSRKILWFEKFYWCISSEGFLIIAGHDCQQNEMIVKRYLTKDDIYVHADIHGATSLVIKNHTAKPIPPKTLNEAACMAVCYSASWEAKVVSAAYWVYSHQVQKTAPTGQYLSVGSFMIRGKKNFLPIQNLILGFGFIFRIDDDSIEERIKLAKTKDSEEDGESTAVAEFPDVSVNLIDETKNDEPKEEEDYTIVNTGEMVKKKVKMITQKTVAKNAKANKKANKKARNANSASKAVEEPAEPIVQTNQEDAEGAQDAQEDAEEEDDGKENEANEGDQDEQEDEEEEEEETKKDFDSQKLLDSLVSNPQSSDHLLYAIPVCGPYASMQQYKYKVKIIPGTARRGKATKLALANFLKDKTATEREKDLLKAVKDQDIAKNLPGKIKIVASHK